MESMARTPSLDVLLALCCECGTTRTVSRRAIGSDGNRPLRCETCRKTTPHAAIGAEGLSDYREEMNGRTTPTLTTADRLDVLRALGVVVTERTGEWKTSSGHQGCVGMWWYVENDALTLTYATGCPSLYENLDEMLSRASDPGKHQWFIVDGQDDDEIVANVTKSQAHRH